MYMYLSDRKRRMYLSLALPQNLSSHPLSIKDRRFLQKTISNIPSLSVPLIKQQNLLYKKHIHSVMKCYRTEKKSCIKLHAFSLICNTYVYFQMWQKSKNYKTIQRNPCFFPYNNFPENSENTKKCISLYKSLCIFVQTIKTQNRSRQKYMDTFVNSFQTSSVYKNQNFDFYTKQHCWSLNTQQATPLFVNGKNKYLYIRFLYNREHIKTNIKPQMLRNPFPVKAKFLHEKKKVHYFYGCYAKKDFKRLSNSAKSLPGLFEDNMYTLLESRVDVLVHRAGFTKTVAMARQLIRQGNFYVNGKKIFSCKIRASPGDIFTLPPHKKIENIRGCYIHTTKALYARSIYKKRGDFHMFKRKKLWKMLSKDFYKTSIFHGYLYPAFFLYKSVCKKTFYNKNKTSIANSQQDIFIASFFLLFKHLNDKSKAKNMCYLQHFLNIYIHFILKYRKSARKFFAVTKKKEHIFEFFMKNLQNANCASIWGQKPLHLEISQKTTAFIYLYRPQKIISPVCIDFYALKI